MALDIKWTFIQTQQHAFIIAPSITLTERFVDHNLHIFVLTKLHVLFISYKFITRFLAITVSFFAISS